MGAARRRSVGSRAWTTPRRAGSTSRASPSLADAQVLYGSGHEIEASGRAPGFRALLGDVWRERGFGDFWGYALLAEGAAEAMVEVGLSPWDAAAPMVLVEEAGGRVTDFDGQRSDRQRHIRRVERPPPRRSCSNDSEHQPHEDPRPRGRCGRDGLDDPPEPGLLEHRRDADIAEAHVDPAALGIDRVGLDAGRAGPPREVDDAVEQRGRDAPAADSRPGR